MKGNLLMVSGDRSILQGKKGAFFYTLEELSKHWERIDVIVPKCKEHSAKDEDFVPRNSDFALPANVHFHASPFDLWYQPWWIVKKGKELIDVHHHGVMTVHDYPPFYNGIGAMWLSKKMRMPFVQEIHHIVGYPKAADAKEWVGRIMSRFCIPFISRRAAAVRVVSSETETILKEWAIPQKKIRGLSSLYLDRDSLNPDPTIPKEYDVVFCARLVANKGLLEFLDSVALMSEKKALVIGDGPMREQAEQYVVKLSIKERVHFTGWLPDKEAVYRAMQSAKVFVMPSKSEGGPRSAIEAMALGIPVVATPVGAMTTTIPEGSRLLIESGNPKDIAAVVSELLRDPIFREREGAIQQQAVRKYDRTVFVKEYARLLKDVASSVSSESFVSSASFS